MDTLTHTVLGVCLGEVIAGKKLGKKAMLIGAAANNFPDIDVISGFFTSPAEGLLAHRGITHSILCCTAFSFLFGWLLFKHYGRLGISFRRLLFLSGSGLFLHISMDACTSYGTGWFEPFSHYRVTFNTLFILDPFFLLPLLIAASILLIMRRSSAKRGAVARIGLYFSLFYLMITIVIKIYVNHLVKNQLLSQNIPQTDYMVAPTPLNNLLWNVITKNDKICYVGYYSVFDRRTAINFEMIQKNDSLLAPVNSSSEVQLLKRFSKNYYSISKDDSSLVFSDLRFGQLGGWYAPKSAFVFNFNIMGKNNAAHIQQGRMKGFESKPIQELVKRIKGKN